MGGMVGRRLRSFAHPTIPATASRPEGNWSHRGESRTAVQPGGTSRVDDRAGADLAK